MKYKQDIKKIICILLLVSLTISSMCVNATSAVAMTDVSMDELDELVSSYSVNKEIPDYREYLNLYEQTFPNQTVEIEATDYVRYEENDKQATPELRKDYEGISGESIITTEDSLVEYEVTIGEAGYYDISILYYPIEGKSSNIQRSIFLDGKLPYGELALLNFNRIWECDIDKVDNTSDAIWKKDNQGNDLKPIMVEKPEWITSYLYDSNGYITEPLKVYFSEGTHTISILAQREPMLFRKIILGNAGIVESYAQVKQGWDLMGITETSGQKVRIEAENATKTSSQMLYPRQDQSSPAVSPSSAKELLNNSMGGNAWRIVGQWIEWDFDVEEDGYYNISMYVKQNFVSGIYVSRKITIDGDVMFDELEDYGFKYKQNWRDEVLADEEGTPYAFYLTKGHHTFRMEVVLGDFSSIISEVQECVTDLNGIYRKVIRVIGVAPDKYRDYQIEATLPELHNELIEVRDRLDVVIKDLRRVAGRSSDKETVLITMRDQLNDLIKDGEHFVRTIAAFKINVRACGNWITQVISQPLEVDCINIYSPDVEVKYENTGFFAKVIYELKRLIFSFFIDYNQIGNIAEDSNENDTITLWIGSGRDQANVIKAMIDETFTNTYGINVNVQLVDMSTLLRATLADEGPDVAIQVANSTGIAGTVLNTGNDTPVNYGIRNAVLDLTSFDDLPEVKKRFSEAAMVAFEFDGSTYALPETITYPVMFYRRDILTELNLKVPQTWDEVKVAMTVLAKNQMEFGMLPSEQIFAMLLYQNGGKYYTEDGSRSLLDSDISINSFKEYCEYYTDYKLDKETSAEERFRTGECPIIIADYTVYNNLVVSAPDIAGLWDFAPVPGREKDDGSIDRSTGCTGLASIIMADTEHPDACWEFLKWWTSADVQTKFGREMESLMGSAARVPTANLEAFSRLPWPRDDYESLKDALNWVKGIPQVPGGYYSWRNVNNAFYSVTEDVSKKRDKTISTPREELMDKVIYINAEIDYKREELGLPIAEE